MLKIVVCIKQVPDTAEMRIDPVTNTLVRDGVKTIMNPYDSYALETALQLKETMVHTLPFMLWVFLQQKQF